MKEYLGCLPVDWIFNRLYIDSVLIGEVVEHIVTCNRCRSRLFVSEYEVNPFMQMLRFDCDCDLVGRDIDNVRIMNVYDEVMQNIDRMKERLGEKTYVTIELRHTKKKDSG